MIDGYIAALDSIESVLDVHTMSVEGVTQIDAFPGKPKINAHYARLTIGDKSAPFSVGMVADLMRCGMTPDRIVEIDRAGHALLFAGTIYAVDVKGGRTTPKSGRFERAALLMAGTHRCRPSGEMVFR